MAASNSNSSSNSSSGNNSFLSYAGLGLQGLGTGFNLGSTAYNMFAGPPPTPPNYTYKQWSEDLPNKLQIMRNFIPMPWYSGGLAEPRGPEYPQGLSPTTQGIYQGYLNQSYGLSPQELSLANQSVFASQALPFMNARTPSSLYAQSMYTPEQAVSALGSLASIPYQDRLSYLEDAVRLAAYNTARTKNALSVIG